MAEGVRSARASTATSSTPPAAPGREGLRRKIQPPRRLLSPSPPPTRPSTSHAPIHRSVSGARSSKAVVAGAGAGTGSSSARSSSSSALSTAANANGKVTARRGESKDKGKENVDAGTDAAAKKRKRSSAANAAIPSGSPPTSASKLKAKVGRGADQDRSDEKDVESARSNKRSVSPGSMRRERGAERAKATTGKAGAAADRGVEEDRSDQHGTRSGYESDDALSLAEIDAAEPDFEEDGYDSPASSRRFAPAPIFFPHCPPPRPRFGVNDLSPDETSAPPTFIRNGKSFTGPGSPPSARKSFDGNATKSHSRTKSLPSLSRKRPLFANFQPKRRGMSAEEQRDAYDDTSSDEDDFHEAMLRSADFEFFGSDGERDSARPSNGNDGGCSDDDTPATTPRSPGPELGGDDVKSTTPPPSDSSSSAQQPTSIHVPVTAPIVFSNALPVSTPTGPGPGSNRLHAGSLTLSLPQPLSPRFSSARASALAAAAAANASASSKSDTPFSPTLAPSSSASASAPSAAADASPSACLGLGFGGLGLPGSAGNSPMLTALPGISVATHGMSFSGGGIPSPGPLLGPSAVSGLGKASYSSSGLVGHATDDENDDDGDAEMTSAGGARSRTPATASSMLDLDPFDPYSAKRRKPSSSLPYKDDDNESVSPASGAEASRSSRSSTSYASATTSPCASPRGRRGPHRKSAKDETYDCADESDSRTSLSCAMDDRMDVDAFDFEAELVLLKGPETMGVEELDRCWGGSSQAECLSVEASDRVKAMRNDDRESDDADLDMADAGAEGMEDGARKATKLPDTPCAGVVCRAKAAVEDAAKRDD